MFQFPDTVRSVSVSNQIAAITALCVQRKSSAVCVSVSECECQTDGQKTDRKYTAETCWGYKASVQPFRVHSLLNVIVRLELWAVGNRRLLPSASSPTQVHTLNKIVPRFSKFVQHHRQTRVLHHQACSWQNTAPSGMFLTDHCTIRHVPDRALHHQVCSWQITAPSDHRSDHSKWNTNNKAKDTAVVCISFAVKIQNSHSVDSVSFTHACTLTQTHTYAHSLCVLSLNCISFALKVESV